MIVVGVDVSTRRVAFADSLGRVKTMDVATREQMPDEAARLADAFHRAGITARQFVNGRPCVVFVEIPSGTHVPPNLSRMTGVVMGGIQAGLAQHSEHPVSVWTVRVSQWKKAALGFGNAGKAQVLAWARDNGYKGQCQKCLGVGVSCKSPVREHDEADALGIAAAGRMFLMAGRMDLAG